MPQNNKAREYLQEVCAHIRWKRAHAVVCRELEAHIEDQQEALIATGMDDAIASDKAIKEMGDAAEVGTLLDRAYRPKLAWNVIAITAALMVFGYFSRLYMIGHSHSLYTIQPFQSLLWLMAAVGALIFGYFLDFTIIVKYKQAVRIGYFTVLALMMATVFESGSSNAIFKYGDYFLILFPVIFPGMLCGARGKGYLGFFSCCAYFAVFVFSGFVIPSFSTGLVCWFIGLFLLTLAIVKGFFRINKLVGLLAVYLPPASFFAWAAINTSLLRRFGAMFASEGVAEHIGYVNVIVREIVNNAKMFGTGSFPSEYADVPNFVPDFALTFFIHNFGWASFFAIIALFASFFIISLRYILKHKNQLGQMVSISILLVLFAEFAIYVMQDLGLGFFGTMSLPLVSQGNPGLMIDSFLIGLMLSVFRAGDLSGGSYAEDSAASDGVYIGKA